MLCLFLPFFIDTDDCRMLEFKPSIVGSSLFDHVIKTHLTVSQDVCELKCYIEDECMSINFGPGDSGAYLCELSDSDHELHPEDLKKRDGFIYRPTKVRFKVAWEPKREKKKIKGILHYTLGNFAIALKDKAG